MRFLKKLVFQKGPRISVKILSATTILKLVNPELKSLLNETYDLFKTETFDLIHEGDEVKFRLKCERHFQVRELDENETLLLGHEFTNSIGHMGLGLATRIRLDNLFSNSQFKNTVVYAKCANEHLLKTYFSKHFKLIKLNNFTYELMRFYHSRLFEEMAYISTKSGPLDLYQSQHNIAHSYFEPKGQIQANFNHLFNLTEDDYKFLQHLLSSWNLDPNKEFVVLHLKKEATREGLRGVTFRNYITTIEHIISTGRSVVFLGDDRQGIEFLADFEGFVDYQNMSCKSSRADTVLLAGCQLAIVSTSGPMNIPGLFGRPILWTNAIGFSQYLPLYNATFIPKLFYERDELVTLKGMFSEPELFFVDSLSEEVLHEYRTRDIKLIENSPTDILRAYLDMEHLNREWINSLRTSDLKKPNGDYMSHLSGSFNEAYPEWADFI
jgi:putative glycosyltransferase (TIGR04372 family)